VLSDGQEHAVNEIVFRMKMAQPAVSKHLGALRKTYCRPSRSSRKRRSRRL
jgi:DNA-binding transcriptional ArsR family regulator